MHHNVDGMCLKHLEIGLQDESSYLRHNLSKVSIGQNSQVEANELPF